jgi:hypothetical protein
VADLIEALKSPGGARMVRSKWIKPALAASIVVAAVAAGIWLWPKPTHPTQLAAAPRENTVPAATFPKTDPIANVTGNWKAVVLKEDVKYEIYFTFEVVGDKVFGKAIYPTGEGGILNGKFDQGRISFITKHVPNFAEEEATITVEGRVSGDEIEVFLQDKDGLSKGVAHRVARTSQPKVLTP